MLRDRLLAAPLAGLLLGGLDVGFAAASGHASHKLGSILVGVGAIVALSLLVGGFGVALLTAAGARWPASPLAAWLAQRFTRDPNAPRAPVVMAHAVLLATSLVALVALVLLDRVLHRLSSLDSESLRRALVLLAVLVLTLAAAIATALLARVLQPWVERVDLRVGLPWPPQPALRRALWVGLPLLVASGAPLVLWPNRLGQLFWAPALVVLLVLVAACVTLIDARAPLLKPIAIGGWIAVALLVMAAALSSLWLPSAALQSSALAERSLMLLRALTDVDLDGDSGLFGGHDCRPFDARIHSMAHDEPGNGVDEDCDGKDARGSVGFPRPSKLFYGSKHGIGFRPRHFNIVWFIAEAIRGDHTSVLGYKKRTTPYLEKLAQDSLSFTHAYSQGSATMLSFPSMLSGSDPSTLRWAQQQDKLQAESSQQFIAERLLQLGYRTLMTTSGYFKANLASLHRGFQNIESFWIDGKRLPWNERASAASMAMAIRLIENDASFPHQRRPFFLLAYLPDAHAPYDPHDEAFPSFGKNSVGLYDGEVAFADRYAGFLLDYLRSQLPSWDDTIVVFNADHGEEFGEHGQNTHGYTCNRQGVHVPLIIKIPGMKPRKIDQPVALLDIVPTLLEAIGEKPGKMALDGQSLLIPALAKSHLDAERPIFCSTLLQDDTHDNFFIRGVRSGQRAYVHDSISGRSALYDIAQDFAEQKDISQQPGEAQTVRALENLLKRSLTGNLWENRLAR